MTEAARLRELSSAMRYRTRLRSILARRTRATREEKCDGDRPSLHHPHATWSGNPNPHLENDPGRYLNLSGITVHTRYLTERAACHGHVWIAQVWMI
jgi:hypothetical protein